MAIYTRADLKSRINAGIKNKIGMLVSANDLINDTVRSVISEVDLRSTKRRAYLSSNLFTDIYTYNCPSDLKAQKIIDLIPQVNRTKLSEIYLVPTEEFSRRLENRTIAVDDRDSLRKLLISLSISDQILTISTLDSVTSGGGTWTTVGDATNLEQDSDNFVKGVASLKWDIGSGATTTAGIKNTSLNTFDFTNYRNQSIFHWVYVTSTTNLTNFVLRIGNDESNYLTKTVTTTQEGTAFVQGWNLLRFDMSTATITGTVDLETFEYAQIHMTKTTGKINETGYRSDHLIAQKGSIYMVSYYSKYGWQNSSGTYMENSTDDSDYLNVDTDEYNMIIQKGIELAASETEDYEIEKKANQRFIGLASIYLDNNPSEAKLMTTTYYDF